MGISLQPNLPNNMVTAQVYIALCVAGVAVAAPQLDFGGLRSVATTREVATSNINQERVVSDVVSALQPSIAEAVAAALAGLQTSTFSSSVSSTSSAAADAERAALRLNLLLMLRCLPNLCITSSTRLLMLRPRPTSRSPRTGTETPSLECTAMSTLTAL